MPKIISNNLRILLKILWIFIVAAGTVSGAFAMFYSNPEPIRVTSDSTLASVSVFKGLSNLYGGLASIESAGETAAGDELLNAASQEFSVALEAYSRLSDSDFAGAVVIRDELSEAANGFLEAQIQRLGRSSPNTAGDVFSLSGASIDQVQSALTSFREVPDIDRYSALLDEVTRALFVGEVGTRLLRTAK